MALESGNGRSSGKSSALETVLPPLDIFLRCFKKNVIVVVGCLAEYNLRFDHRLCNAGVLQALDHFLSM
jgi:hypothetical protein